MQSDRWEGHIISCGCLIFAQHTCDGLQTSALGVEFDQSRDLDALRAGASAALQAVLARTGHTATMAGKFLVIAGGITRNASPHTHVLMVDMQDLKFVT